MTLPMYMLATRPQKSGMLRDEKRPGLNPHSTSAASRMAVVPEPGMPSVRSGTSAPPVSELLAPSGAATPSMTPVPNCSRRGTPPFPAHRTETTRSSSRRPAAHRRESLSPSRSRKRTAILEVLHRREKIPQPFGHRQELGFLASFHVCEHFGERNTPIATTTKSMLRAAPSARR